MKKNLSKNLAVGAVIVFAIHILALTVDGLIWAYFRNNGYLCKIVFVISHYVLSPSILLAVMLSLAAIVYDKKERSLNRSFQFSCWCIIIVASIYLSFTEILPRLLLYFMRR